MVEDVDPIKVGDISLDLFVFSNDGILRLEVTANLLLTFLLWGSGIFRPSTVPEPRIVAQMHQCSHMGQDLTKQKYSAELYHLLGLRYWFPFSFRILV